MDKKDLVCLGEIVKELRLENGNEVFHLSSMFTDGFKIFWKSDTECTFEINDLLLESQQKIKDYFENRKKKDGPYTVEVQMKSRERLKENGWNIQCNGTFEGPGKDQWIGQDDLHNLGKKIDVHLSYGDIQSEAFKCYPVKKDTLIDGEYDRAMDMLSNPREWVDVKELSPDNWVSSILSCISDGKKVYVLKKNIIHQDKLENLFSMKNAVEKYFANKNKPVDEIKYETCLNCDGDGEIELDELVKQYLNPGEIKLDPNFVTDNDRKGEVVTYQKPKRRWSFNSLIWGEDDPNIAALKKQIAAMPEKIEKKEVRHKCICVTNHSCKCGGV